MDYLYPEEILFTVDTKIQRFISQNKKIKDREEVREILVNFGNLIDMCLSQSFNMSLPSVFGILTERPDDHTTNCQTKKMVAKEEEAQIW